MVVEYVNEDGEQISAFYEFNKEMKKELKEKVCTNPECKDLNILVHYKCTETRPLIYLGKRCWSCKKTEFLKPYQKV